MAASAVFLVRRVAHNLYYVKSGTHRSEKTGTGKKICRQLDVSQNAHGDIPNNCGPVEKLHVITSQEQEKAVEIIRWVYSVAKMPADSPRFAYYVSRWRVPEKIEAAREAGILTEILEKSPPIDPSWVRFVPAALAEYEAFTKPATLTTRPAAQSSGKRRAAGNRQRLAA